MDRHTTAKRRVNAVSLTSSPQRQRTSRFVLRNLATIGLILVLVTGGIVGCSEESTADVETATRLIEEWAAGWNNDDVNALAAVFTEEATCACEGCHTSKWVGREDIRSNVPVSTISDIAFTTPVAVSADGVFTSAVEFLWAGDPFTADVEFEVGDSLITRMLVARFHQVDERTGGDPAA